MIYQHCRPLLFSLDPERAHTLACGALAAASRLPPPRRHKPWYWRPVEVMGLRLPNPVGLAAGFDKHAQCANALAWCGFGWFELGTVTPLPQPGNPRPRLFRLEDEQALINRLGFNSVGLQAFLKNLKTISPQLIRGINLGQNAATPPDRAADDYLRGLRAVYTAADYVTINISSPNTPHLRALQQPEALADLLKRITEARAELTDKHARRLPLALKIAPELPDPQLAALADLCVRHHIDAVIATNTTTDRTCLHRPEGHPEGGLSGAPLRARSTEVVAALTRMLPPETAVIGCGGIDSPAAAQEKLDAGARAIQLYTGLIYKGPGLVREILRALI